MTTYHLVKEPAEDQRQECMMSSSETHAPRLHFNDRNESRLAELQQISQQLRSLQQEAVHFQSQDNNDSLTVSSASRQGIANLDIQN